MLEKLRDASKGWLAVIMIVVLIGSVGVWGVADIANLTAAPRMATVGGDVVSPEEYQEEFSQFLAQMNRASESEMTAAEAKATNLDRVALDRLVEKLALMKKAKGLGLVVTSAQIANELRSVPGLVESNGKLNPGILQQLARANTMEVPRFLEIVSAKILRDQLLNGATGGLTLPGGLENALHLYRLERRTVEYVILDEARAGTIADPADEVLKKFYNTNADLKYSIPEYRTVVLVTAGPKDVASAVQVTDEEIKKVYDANKSRYETPEKRTLHQIRFKTEAAARAAKLKLNGGQTFEAVAKAEGFLPADINLGKVSKGDTSVPVVAFELAVNAISEPVNGPFGWVILRVIDTTPGSSRAYDEVKEEIRKSFTDERSKEKLFDLTNALEDTLGGGATLEEAAKTHKLTLRTFTLDREGKDNAGVPAPGLPGGEFLTQVFAADTSTEPELLQTADGTYYEFRIDKIVPRTRKAFDTVKAQVLADWRLSQVDTKLGIIAAELVKRGNGGEAISSIAQSLGMSALTSEPLPRFGKNVVFSEAAIASIAATKNNKFFSGPVAAGRAITVGVVTKTEFEKEPSNAPLRGYYGQNLQNSFVSDVTQQFAKGVRADVGVEIDEVRFKAFHDGE